MNRLRYDETTFLINSLKISLSNLEKLTEEKSDLDLLIEVASDSSLLTKDTFQSFSPLFAFKTIIFRYSKFSSFELKEKIYVSHAADESYGKLVSGLNNGSSVKTLSSFLTIKPTEETAKSLLVASGLLNTRLAMNLNTKTHIYSIEDGFRFSGLRELALHVPDWIIILRKIQSDGWLSISSQKQLTAPDKIKKV